MSGYHIKRKKSAIRLHMNQQFHTETELESSQKMRGRKAKRIQLISLFFVILAFFGAAVFVAGKMGLLGLTFGKETLTSSEVQNINSTAVSENTAPPPAPPSSAENDTKPAEQTDNGSQQGAVPPEQTEEPPQPEKKADKPPANPPDYTLLYPDMTVPKADFIEHNPDDKVIYLTFDDGPCQRTPKLLDVLDELDVKATFFVSAQFGGQEEILKDLKEIDARGNKIGVNSYTHQYRDIYSSVPAFLDDYKKMDDLIVQATGKRSSVFRFPGGSNTGYNEGVRKALLTEMNRRGFVYHDWNAHNGDSEGYAPDAQVERAVREASSNSKSVILMHDTPDKGSVVDVLPQIVNQLKAKGYRFDVIDETVRPFQFAVPE